MISPSPFSVKSLALMELSGLAYTRVHGDPRHTPKGKLPILIDGERVIADSDFIQTYLAQAHGVDLDAQLSPSERAQALALRMLIEEHLYWVLAYSRWVDNPTYTRGAFLAALPALIRPVVFRIVQKQVKSGLHGQGMGRHDRADIYALGERALAALADWLGDRPFFMGAQATNVDTTAFGMLETLLASKLRTPLSEAAQQQPQLVAYHQRMRSLLPGLHASA